MASVAGGRGSDLFASIAESLADMSDEHCDYIVDTCLLAVSRQQGDVWVKVYNERAKALQFDDIELADMFQITKHVIEENLGGFFIALRAIGAGTPSATA
jgi:hypothetical protein